MDNIDWALPAAGRCRIVAAYLSGLRARQIGLYYDCNLPNCFDIPSFCVVEMVS